MKRSKRAGPFQANCCDMPKPASKKMAAVYQGIRDLVVTSHCADKRPAHTCAGKITIDRDGILLQCQRCGDAKEIFPIRPK